MARYARSLFLILAALCLVMPLAASPARATGLRDDIPLPCDGTPTTFSSAITTVAVCPATVQTGQVLQIGVRSRRLTHFLVQLLLPDGTTPTRRGFTDQTGLALLALPIRYNPLNRYAKAQLQVIVGKPGSPLADTVTGTITIVQAPALGRTVLLVRGQGSLGWCPVDPLACTVRNGETLIIRVDTDGGAQVAITITYPDGQTTSCAGNDLTGTAFADPSGVYRCEQPVAFQARAAQRGSCLLVTATVSANSATKSLFRKLCLG